MESNRETALKARAYVFLLLKYRQRSEYEISLGLKKKKFPQETIKETLAFLREKKFIDDNVFAGAWIKERIARGIGPLKLQRELKLKGIEKQIIEDNLRQAKDTYSELETARGLAESRLGRLKNLPLPIAKRRIYGYLLRRGFSPETIIDVLNQFE